MRIKQNRLKTYYCRTRIFKKDNEGSTYEEWGAAIPFSGESWPASGKAQAQQYGERLPYIYNLKIDGEYVTSVDDKGIITYEFNDGLKIRETDGICLFVGQDKSPDYKVISIRPYHPLKLEIERI